MKKIIPAIAIVACIVFIVFGQRKWNEKLDVIAVKAQESLKNYEIPHKQVQNSQVVDENISDSEEINGDLAKGETTEKDASDANQEHAVEPPAADETTDAAKSSTAQSQNTNQSPNQKTTQSSKAEKSQKSVMEVKQPYYPKFQDLQNQQQANANQLIAGAKNDLQRVKNGEITQGDLERNYQTQAQKLEGQTDENFNRIYGQLKADLTANGHSVNEAQEFRLTYNKKKQEYHNLVNNEISKMY